MRLMVYVLGVGQLLEGAACDAALARGVGLGEPGHASSLRERERHPPTVSPGLPSRKIAGKRPVDDGRMAFPGAVRLLFHGVDIALLDMIGLPGQLALWGVILLGEDLPLLPPVRDGLKFWPDSHKFLKEQRAGDHWGGLDARRVL